MTNVLTRCHSHTEPGKRMVPRLGELFRQGQAEVVSNSKNKILATWEPFLCRALYSVLPSANSSSLLSTHVAPFECGPPWSKIMAKRVHSIPPWVVFCPFAYMSKHESLPPLTCRCLKCLLGVVNFWGSRVIIEECFKLHQYSGRQL